MNSIYHRISVRKYQDKPVESGKVLEILKAGMQAPSADNQQPWEFYVVYDSEKRKALAKVHKWTYMAAQAPVVIVPAYREDSPDPDFVPEDMGACMENMWLMADSLGLGAVWCGIAPMEDRMKKAEEICDMEPGHRAFAIFSVGYPAESRPQEDRFSADRIHVIGEQK